MAPCGNSTIGYRADKARTPTPLCEMIRDRRKLPGNTFT